MTKYLGRILFFVALVCTYFVVREFVSLYVMMYEVHPYAGYGTAAALVLIVLIFVVIPIYRIVAMPRMPATCSVRWLRSGLMSRPPGSTWAVYSMRSAATGKRARRWSGICG